MGHKSTTRLTRQQGIERYAELKTELKRRKYEAQATALTDEELGDALDDLADRAYNARNGTHEGGFDNFVITSHPGED